MKKLSPEQIEVKSLFFVTSREKGSIEICFAQEPSLDQSVESASV
jgi:hypothetical protein